MTRGKRIGLVVGAVAVAIIVVALVFDDGSDDWHGGRTTGSAPPPPGRSSADDEAVRAAREQFERVFARCGDIHRAQRATTGSGGRSGGGGPVLVPVETEFLEYRGLTFDPKPKPLTEVEALNKVTWHGDVVMSFTAVRGPGRGDMLWRRAEPLVVDVQKRNGNWDRSKLLTELQQKQRWNGRC